MSQRVLGSAKIKSKEVEKSNKKKSKQIARNTEEAEDFVVPVIPLLSTRWAVSSAGRARRSQKGKPQDACELYFKRNINNISELPLVFLSIPMP